MFPLQEKSLSLHDDFFKKTEVVHEMKDETLILCPFVFPVVKKDKKKGTFYFSGEDERRYMCGPDKLCWKQ